MRRKGAKGAVSVFLVIILVPMLTISALFVDASKLMLAKSVATSAGDLALNTALTDYDSKLKEMYGLLATAQDTDELYEKLEDYYRSCITSSGVSDEDANEIVNEIMASLGANADSETSDVLNMELVDFEVSKVDGAAMNNATILKNQIVQFMKYRGPINTGLGFLNALESFTTLDKQTDLIEKRTDYYEAQQTVNETLKAAWQHIVNYNNTSVVMVPDYIKSMRDTANGYKDVYATNHEKTVKDLFETQGDVGFNCSAYQQTKTVKDAAGNETEILVWRLNTEGTTHYDYTHYYDKENGGYDLENLPTTAELKNLIETFYSRYETMDDNLADLPTYDSTVYDLQYLAQNNRNAKISSYTSAMKNMYYTYRTLKNAMIWVEGYDLTEVVDEDDNVITAQTVKSYSFTANGQTKTVAQHFSQIESLFDAAMSDAKINYATYSSIATTVANNNLTDTSSVNSSVSSIATYMKAYVDELEKAKEELDGAVSDLNSAITSVESGALKAAENSWKTAASKDEVKNTSIGKQDLAEIKDLSEQFNLTEMRALVTRLSNISSCLEENITQLKGYKFDGKYIGEIDSYDVFKSAMSNKHGANTFKNISIIESTLLTDEDSLFEWTSGNINADWTNDSEKNPKLSGSGTDTLNFYSYLKTQFSSVTPEGSDTQMAEENEAEGKDLYNKIGEKSSSNASSEIGSADNGNKTSANELKDIANKPSSGVGSSDAYATAKTGDDAVSGTSSGLSSMFSSLTTALVGMGVDLRDNMYVSDYIINMFSYDTIEAEYKDKNGDDADISKIQTMTLQPINAENNFAYGKEVEYIIYGGSNTANTASAYGSIYAIRLGFNLVYAFMDSEIRDSAFAMATPISAATLGVIPVPLIQAAIIIGIACCESGVDLSNLKDGEAVPLYKSKQTWYISVSGLINYVKSEGEELAKKATSYVVDESSKKLTEMLDMTDEQLNANLDENAAELSGYLGNVYDTTITQHATTAIQKTTTLVNNVICKEGLNPEQQAAAVAQGLDDWLAEEAVGIDVNTDIAYIAKEAAVQVIKDEYIPQLITAMQSPGNTVANAGQEILDVLAGIRLKITDKVTNANDKIKEYKSQMLEEVKGSVAEGADKLKETINSKLDAFSGNTTSPVKDKTMQGALLSFRYSDYLRLFLLIGLYTNEEGVLLRTADAIQKNMSIITDEEDYVLSSSAAYVQINATIRVKPTLMALPLFNDVEGNPFSDGQGYEFEYFDVKGY